MEYLSKASVAYLSYYLTQPEKKDDRESAAVCHNEILQLLMTIQKEVTEQGED